MVSLNNQRILKESVLMCLWLSEDHSVDSSLCIKKLHQDAQIPNPSLAITRWKENQLDNQ